MRIAILGATSHIAKNLIVGLAPENQLSLFARSIEKTTAFLEDESIDKGIAKVQLLDIFGTVDDHYNAIINCIGFGTPEKQKSQGAQILFVTERYDNAVLEYLSRNRSAVYINFSSGAIYGTDNNEPVDGTSEFRLRLGSISVADAYRVSKLNSETKHRSLTDYSIIDLRLFSFFSRYIDMCSSYLIVEIINSIKNGTEFVTNSMDIIRDYVHPRDLCNLVYGCAKTCGINRAFDVYSKRPSNKNEIIRAFIEKYGLKVKIGKEIVGLSPTGVKSCYMSNSRDAGEILNYTPRYTSIAAVLDEAQALLANIR
jgi:nucleoside-diphosphate-sugar epimerase